MIFREQISEYQQGKVLTFIMKWFEIPHQDRALAAGIQEPEDIYFPHFVLCAEKSDIWGGSAIFPCERLAAALHWI